MYLLLCETNSKIPTYSYIFMLTVYCRSAKNVPVFSKCMDWIKNNTGEDHVMEEGQNYTGKQMKHLSMKNIYNYEKLN